MFDISYSAAPSQASRKNLQADIAWRIGAFVFLVSLFSRCGDLQNEFVQRLEQVGNLKASRWCIWIHFPKRLLVEQDLSRVSELLQDQFHALIGPQTSRFVESPREAHRALK